MNEARRAGWWLKTAGGSAHGYGFLYCRRTGNAEYCRFAVWTTAGSNSEDTAHLIREKVAKCPHRDPLSEPGETTSADELSLARLNAAHFHLDRADHLVGAVEILAQHQELRDRAEVLLEEAELQARDAARLLDEAVLHEEQARQAALRARDLAHASGMGAEPWPPEDAETQLVRPAQHDLDTAERILAGGEGADVREARQRLDQLRSRLTQARDRLARPGH